MIDPGGRRRASRGPLRIAMLAAPLLPVPPLRYGGTERVVAALAEGLTARGHDVTLFGAGDSTVGCRLVPVVPHSIWPDISGSDATPFIRLVADVAAAHQSEFDIIHSHLEGHGLPFARRATTPVLATLHGRIDIGPTRQLLKEFSDVPLVAISDNQRSWAPRANWLATIHHGLPFDDVSLGDGRGDYLAFVGRIAPEKGIRDTIELGRRTGLTVRMAAKSHQPSETALFDKVVRPAIDEGMAEFLGEVTSDVRNQLFAGARATLMLGAWPEPFGLVAIESLANGTPVIARRSGALPEIIGQGIDGFLVDDLRAAEKAVRAVDHLDRRAIRVRALMRFSLERMVDRYEHVYRALIADRGLEVSGQRALLAAPARLGAERIASDS
jgi:glycosyltransferase involved in cell wall biosynthesis